MTVAKSGRPPTLTPEVQARICALIVAGNFRDTAARATGIPVRTMRDWCRKGREQKRGSYRDFLHALLEAEKAAEIVMVKLVVEAALGDVDHARWWLERKVPRHWGRNRMEMSLLKGKVTELEKLITSKVDELNKAIADVTGKQDRVPENGRLRPAR
jgi:hypothetical protein